MLKVIHVMMFCGQSKKTGRGRKYVSSQKLLLKDEGEREKERVKEDLMFLIRTDSCIRR